MSALEEWNLLGIEDATQPILACCGSQAFAAAMVNARPFANWFALLEKADTIWWSLTEDDWLQAFRCHPRIGESPAAASSHQFSAWSKQEQSEARAAAAPVLASIRDKNQEYEARHGFRYIVCASGRSGGELLGILERRIDNPTAVEIKEAAEQQRQITHLRLRKWLAS